MPCGRGFVYFLIFCGCNVDIGDFGVPAMGCDVCLYDEGVLTGYVNGISLASFVFILHL